MSLPVQPQSLGQLANPGQNAIEGPQSDSSVPPHPSQGQESPERLDCLQVTGWTSVTDSEATGVMHRDTYWVRGQAGQELPHTVLTSGGSEPSHLHVE